MNRGRPSASSVLIATGSARRRPRGLAAAVEDLQQVLQDVAVVLLGEARAACPTRSSAISRSSSIDGMSTTADGDAALRRSTRRRPSASCTPRPLLTITARSSGALAQHVSLAELERVVAPVDHGRRRPHDAHVEQAAIARHVHCINDSICCGQETSTIFRWAMPSKIVAVVVAHVRRAVGPRLEVGAPSPASSDRGRGPRSASRPAPRSLRDAPGGRRRCAA